MSTYMPKPGEVKAGWHVVDATDQVLGRLAAKIAVILQGKHKPTYTPHVDTGDFVIVLNAENVKVTGNKSEVMEYDTYSRYPGGRNVYSFHPDGCNTLFTDGSVRFLTSSMRNCTFAAMVTRGNGDIVTE